jgi:predicted MFS family arabinose efflux permease
VPPNQRPVSARSSSKQGSPPGATVGGLTLDVLGVASIPVVALAFTVGSIIIAGTLRQTIRNSTP